MSGEQQTKHWLKAETRLVRPGERLMLPHAISGDSLEEMRSLEVEREHDVGAERWQRLRGSDARRQIVATSARINERLVAERLHEIESSCRGSRSGACACSY